MESILHWSILPTAACGAVDAQVQGSQPHRNALHEVLLPGQGFDARCIGLRVHGLWHLPGFPGHAGRGRPRHGARVIVHTFQYST